MLTPITLIGDVLYSPGVLNLTAQPRVGSPRTLNARAKGSEKSDTILPGPGRRCGQGLRFRNRSGGGGNRRGRAVFCGSVPLGLGEGEVAPVLQFLGRFLAGAQPFPRPDKAWLGPDACRIFPRKSG